ncbi:hypothetical protein OPKNFCMD_4144 [Methylobacterium crusticola]|uniref:MbtH-like domain-containing protein n=1 Tax=Methylobacterium crusticola TaxID=1697972 RepID=A0ABQ4R136_9HYPH|nr:MbtH family protein [Methylobacterium crusticola]GJD51390.1 hypothetical protein OPKNFCMD_4144 [Methylobacterium crusticola]
MDEAQADWQDETVTVVVNHEGRYALWPAHRPPPAGWREVGRSGPKDACLAYVAEVWPDPTAPARDG